MKTCKEILNTIAEVTESDLNMPRDVPVSISFTSNEWLVIAAALLQAPFLHKTEEELQKCCDMGNAAVKEAIDLGIIE